MRGIINPPTTISFIRHGQVDNPENIFYGRLPEFKLNSHGRIESIRASKAFKDTSVDAIYSSPMLRARQTAKEIMRYHPHLKLHISSLITEVCSACQGQSNKQLARFKEDIYANEDSQYEQPEDVFHRTQTFIRRTRKRHNGRHVLAVTHGDVILFLIFCVNKIPVTANNKLKLKKLGILKDYPATGSITTLTYQTNDITEYPMMSYFLP